MAQTVKNLHAMWEIQVLSLGQEDPQRREWLPHSSVLAWRIPWTVESGGPQPIRSRRVGPDGVISTHYAVQWH